MAQEEAHTGGPVADRAGNLIDRALWVRWVIAALVGAAAFAAMPDAWPLAVRVLAAWDGALLAALAVPWWLIFHADPAISRARARSSDPGRFGLLAISLLASMSSFGFAIWVLDDPGPAAAAVSTLGENLLVAFAVLGGWALLQTGFALHYARMYYTSRGPDPGLQFTDPPPDDLDFAYFAFGIGMAFEPSDVTVTTRGMRRTVLAHGVISFLYNFSILGLMVSLIAGRV